MEKIIFKTDSGIVTDEVYNKAVTIGENPGEWPFLRGIQKDMYRGKLWTMRQYAGFSTAEESNQRYHYLLKQGTTGLSVAFDLPTQIGYDSDHPMSEGEVGKVGVAIDSLLDMELLFDGIKLENISTSMTINATASTLLAFYIVLAKKQGADLRKISGTIQNDILKEYVARGTYIYPPKPSMRLITDIFEYCGKEVPKWNTISISGYHIREAGSTAVQELAFTLANAKQYLVAAIDKGLDINVFGKRLSFFFNSHNNFFEEVAKFRAARRMWAKMTKEMGATDEKAMMLRFHTQTGGCTLQAQQSHNNIVRVTMQALAAVMGGTQSLHTNGFDEAMSLPTKEAARIALRTQQIIAHETGVTHAVDPMGGSYYLEELTNRIEEEAWKYIRKIDSLGGAVNAIEQGYIQKEIAAASFTYQKEIENNDKIIVGLNSFTTEEEVKPPVMKIDDSIRISQTERLNKLRSMRDSEKADLALLRLEEHARQDSNLMPLIIDAAENLCSLGEISQTLRNVFGEYRA